MAKEKVVVKHLPTIHPSKPLTATALLIVLERRAPETWCGMESIQRAEERKGNPAQLGYSAPSLGI